MEIEKRTDFLSTVIKVIEASGSKVMVMLPPTKDGTIAFLDFNEAVKKIKAGL